MNQIEVDSKCLEIKAILSTYIDELRLAQPNAKWYIKALGVKQGSQKLDDLINDLRVDMESNHKRKEVVEMLSKVENFVNNVSRLIIDQQKKIDSMEVTLNNF